MAFTTKYKDFFLSFLTLTSPLLSFSSNSKATCTPITTDNVLILDCSVRMNSGDPDLLDFRVKLADNFSGELWCKESDPFENTYPITATTTDTIVELRPVIDKERRICSLLSDYPLKKDNLIRIDIPAGTFEVCPNYIEVDSIDINEELLTGLSVAGAWHKSGSKWNLPGMFSIIDDDSLDGQIKSSSQYGNQGYYSLLYPLLESLGLRGNIAAEGKRTGLDLEPPMPNDNLRTLVRLQNEKGWDILAHSMICLGEILNNWRVDSLDSPLAKELLAIGPNNGEDASTISIYDTKTGHQYWPNSDNSAWILTPSKFIKPYIGNYDTKKTILYNPEFDIDWHWGEWKRRAIEFGVEPKGFVTHNATSSHAMVPGIMEYFPEGFSDLSTLNINTPPLLSSAVRSGLEGQSIKGYDGNNNDNTFNKEHFEVFCSQIDEAAKNGGWIMFNLHAYRGCWKNSLPGALVSEGGDYPDSWVIPMKGIDSANAPLTPPATLGISDWSEWYPCPGTRLHMMWEVLKYAKEKGLINVTSSEGFEIMGNKKAYGYFNNGHKIGMDGVSTIGTREKYPHYIVGANDEVYYYNPLLSESISYESKDIQCVGSISSESGEFIISGSTITWNSSIHSDVTLHVMDLTGKEIILSSGNSVCLDAIQKGVYIVVASNPTKMLKTVKVMI